MTGSNENSLKQNFKLAGNAPKLYTHSKFQIFITYIRFN